MIRSTRAHHAIRTGILLGLVALAPGAGGQAAAEDPPPAPPELRLDDRARPLAYDVALEIDPSQPEFRGSVAIELAIERPLRVLWLHGRELEVERAELMAGERRLEPRVVAGGEEFLGFVLPEEVRAGRARLTVAYRGQIAGTETAGIFRQEDRGRWYAFTQFEATFARRAFPCFDEPSFKTPWRLAITAPPGSVAVANTPLVRREEVAAGRRFRFAESEPLPSYLVAFAVGPFETVAAGEVGATPLRIVSLAGKADGARYAAEITAPLLALEERYTGIPYPYAKLDSLAIPQTVGFGAMENVGLMTYAERLILATPAEETEQFRRRYAAVAAHEIAHQWFGNLVTPKWWDDIWLNESFATWMEPKTIAAWRPDWEPWLERLGDRAEAMGSDALVSARPIRRPIATAHDIQSAFDSISYEKGAAILHMFEAWLGEEPFRAGIQRYLLAHAHGTASSADFLAALAAATRPEVAAAFASFLDQPGVPLVRVELSCPPGGAARGAEPEPALALSQERFLPVGTAGERRRTWQLPVCASWDAGGERGRACTLLTAERGTLPLVGAGACPDWVVGNAGGDGYYLAAYEGDLLARLIAAAGELAPADRRALLDEIAALSHGGAVPMDRALTAAEAFAADDSRHIVTALLELTGDLDQHLVPARLDGAYASWIRDLFGQRARNLGFLPSEDEPDDARLVRDELVAVVADEGEDPELRRQARRLAARWLEDRSAVPAEVAGMVLEVAALDGDAALFERFVAAARAEKDRRHRNRLLAALAEFREPALRRRALDLFAEGAFDPREAADLLWEGLEHPPTRELVWGWVREHFDAVAAVLPPPLTARLPRIAAGFCDEEHRRELAEFFGPRAEAYPGGPRYLDQALESIRLCAARREAQAPRVAAYLESRAGAAAGAAPSTAAAGEGAGPPS